MKVVTGSTGYIGGARAVVVTGVPGDLMEAGGLDLIYQRAHRLAEEIVDIHPHRAGCGQLVVDHPHRLPAATGSAKVSSTTRPRQAGRGRRRASGGQIGEAAW